MLKTQVTIYHFIGNIDDKKICKQGIINNCIFTEF